jgi:hypothetical protein
VWVFPKKYEKYENPLILAIGVNEEQLKYKSVMNASNKQ